MEGVIEGLGEGVAEEVEEAERRGRSWSRSLFSCTLHAIARLIRTTTATARRKITIHNVLLEDAVLSCVESLRCLVYRDVLLDTIGRFSSKYVAI
jgi:hypothetical protein